MKFSKNSGLVALGLAGSVLADGGQAVTLTGAITTLAGDAWASAPPGPPGPPGPPVPITVTNTVTNTATITATAKITIINTSTVTATTTTTETLTKEATTIYRSTVLVAPGVCTSTIVNVDPATGGKPWPPPGPAPTGVAPAGQNDPPQAPAAPTGSWGPAPPAPAASTATITNSGKPPGPPPPPGPPTAVTSTVTIGKASTVTLVDPSAPPADGNWLDWANDVTTLGTDENVWVWTGAGPVATQSGPAPTYTGVPGGSGGSGGGNGSLPVPGSSSSNVTAPYEALPEGKCNTAGDRSKWCDGQSINVDAYTAGYKSGKTCSYDFTITNTTLDFDGSGPKLALAINGQVPGPTIECNWGDILQVTVHNKMQDNSTTIHWHGITQKGSNDQDGVPGVTECAIAPGSSRTYTMWLEQYGTGWYHSHVLAQYGDGIRGPMIIHGPATSNYDFDMGTVMIDDTFPVTAQQQNERISHFGPSG